MSDGQFFAALTAIFIILALSLGAHFKWLRADSVFSSAVIFIATALAIGMLGIMKVPPAWFAGGKTGFALALSFCVGAFLGREARWFRLPMFLGMGLPLLVFNVLAHLQPR